VTCTFYCCYIMHIRVNGRYKKQVHNSVAEISLINFVLINDAATTSDYTAWTAEYRLRAIA
jgi:hypothetical protein